MIHRAVTAVLARKWHLILCVSHSCQYPREYWALSVYILKKMLLSISIDVLHFTHFTSILRRATFSVSQCNQPFPLSVFKHYSKPAANIFWSFLSFLNIRPHKRRSEYILISSWLVWFFVSTSLPYSALYILQISSYSTTNIRTRTNPYCTVVLSIWCSWSCPW